jgi:UDP-N-acetylmuramoyl-tripeptide--D-alanyl-D-alanine ligase
VRAALHTLATVGAGRRTWAVLGEMRELGDQSAVAHEDIGRAAVHLGVQKVVFIGEGAQPAYLGARAAGAVGEESMFVPDVASAQRLLEVRLIPGDVVLIKASRSIGLDRLATALIEGGRA